MWVNQTLRYTYATLKYTTPYYPEANGMIKRGHRRIKDTLEKMCGESDGKWREYLPLVLFADRISTKHCKTPNGTGPMAVMRRGKVLF